MLLEFSQKVESKQTDFFILTNYALSQLVRFEKFWTNKSMQRRKNKLSPERFILISKNVLTINHQNRSETTCMQISTLQCLYCSLPREYRRYQHHSHPEMLHVDSLNKNQSCYKAITTVNFNPTSCIMLHKKPHLKKLLLHRLPH